MNQQKANTMTPRELQLLYSEGKNITQAMRENQGLKENTDEIIEMAYELQSGSYTKAMANRAFADSKDAYASELARTILSLGTPSSILEAGVGEATTMAGVLRHLPPEIPSYGFDLSWSRIAYAKHWLEKHGIANSTLCTGNLFDIPFADNSVDFVYTSHSIEPNGGKELPIMRELLRVTRRYLILLEPGYEFADTAGQKRMELHGYCQNLRGTAELLNAKILDHRLFPFTANPLNPTAITIIEKTPICTPSQHILACPQFKTKLEDKETFLYSPEALAVYPIICGIPCLRRQNAILATQLNNLASTLR